MDIFGGDLLVTVCFQICSISSVSIDLRINTILTVFSVKRTTPYLCSVCVVESSQLSSSSANQNGVLRTKQAKIPMEIYSLCRSGEIPLADLVTTPTNATQHPVSQTPGRDTSITNDIKKKVFYIQILWWVGQIKSNRGVNSKLKW